MSQELIQFDKLKADITVFVAPVMSVEVSDPQSSQSAIDVAKDIKGYLKAVDDKRKELVGPLNDRVKMINDYCKQITAPLLNAETHVKGQLNAFAAQQETIRQDAVRKAEAERREAERVAAEERERQEQELMAKQEADAEAHAKAVELFGTGDVSVEEHNKAIDEAQQKEWAENQAKLDREAMERSIAHKQNLYDANQEQIKNTRKTLKCRVIDIAKVPREFLIIEVNEKAALAAAKAGVKIAGLEFYEDISVAIGARTYMPGTRRG